MARTSTTVVLSAVFMMIAITARGDGIEPAESCAHYSADV